MARTFEEYVALLSQLTSPFDPTLPTPESEEIRAVARGLRELPAVNREALAVFVVARPSSVPVLGLAVGLTREKLKNVLRHQMGSSSWTKLAREQPGDLISMLDEQYDLVRLVREQRERSYDFGDILVARAATRRSAKEAGATGRRIEDEIEVVASGLGLSYQTRTRFVGRNYESAPCDLAIPAGGDAARIVVAAKGFDSTGSKLTDAVREIEEMAQKRTPTQFVMAAVDGIGWKSRLNDLRRIYALLESRQIDGLYALATMDDFRGDLERAARRLDLIH